MRREEVAYKLYTVGSEEAFREFSEDEMLSLLGYVTSQKFTTFSKTSAFKEFEKMLNKIIETMINGLSVTGARMHPMKACDIAFYGQGSVSAGLKELFDRLQNLYESCNSFLGKREGLKKSNSFGDTGDASGLFSKYKIDADEDFFNEIKKLQELIGGFSSYFQNPDAEISESSKKEFDKLKSDIIEETHRILEEGSKRIRPMSDDK